MNPRPLWIAGRFLSRLPFPDPGPLAPDEPGRAVPWYPAVGLLLGGLLALGAWLLAALAAAPAGLAAALLLALWVWSTGALHLDGLADTADAWVGGLGSRERTLAIMKDPRTGSMGVTALVLVLLLKWAALEALLTLVQPAPGADGAGISVGVTGAAGAAGVAGTAGGTDGLVSPEALAALPADAQPETLILLAGLLAVPLLARAQLPLLLLTTPYARVSGMAAAAVGQLPRRAAWGAALATWAGLLGIAGWIGAGWLGLAAILLALGLFWLVRRALLARLGGFTGDTAGALVELTETLLLVALALMAG